MSRWQQTSLWVCEMLLYPLRQGVEGTDLFEVSVGDCSFFLGIPGEDAFLHFVPSLLIASSINYQQTIMGI